MRRQLLDTTALTALLADRPANVSLLTPALSRDELATSNLAYGEVLEYLKGAPDFPRRRAQLRRLVRGVRPYLVTYPMVERYAEIRRQLRPPHGPGLIGDIDTLIAATALTADLELITTDRDFTRVPGLRVLLLDRTTFRPLRDVT
jgi:predicted nucleic acid-binding protein